MTSAKKIKKEVLKELDKQDWATTFPSSLVEDAIDLAISKTEKVLLKHWDDLGDEVLDFMASEDFAPIDKVNYCNQRVEEVIKKYKRYKVFHDHIKAHFEKDHPDWKVICKICDKPIDEIYNQYKKELKLVKELVE